MSTSNLTGSTVVERNLDRLTVVVGILFGISTFAADLYPELTLGDTIAVLFGRCRTGCPHRSEWRNWKTRQTKDLVGCVKPRGGSSPLSDTAGRPGAGPFEFAFGKLLGILCSPPPERFSDTSTRRPRNALTCISSRPDGPLGHRQYCRPSVPRSGRGWQPLPPSCTKRKGCARVPATLMTTRDRSTYVRLAGPVMVGVGRQLSRVRGLRHRIARTDSQLG